MPRARPCTILTDGRNSERRQHVDTTNSTSVCTVLDNDNDDNDADDDDDADDADDDDTRR